MKIKFSSLFYNSVDVYKICSLKSDNTLGQYQKYLESLVSFDSVTNKQILTTTQLYNL